MIYFIVNQTARTGKSRQVWAGIRTILKEKNVEYKAFRTKYKGHATELARQISGLPGESIKLVIVGGDGTINEVVNGIQNFDRVLLGIIPAGSGNDFARGIGLSKNIRENMERILLSDSYHAYDIGRVSSPDIESPRLFAISSGFGMDAIVCKKALTSKLKTVLNKLHIGKLTYLLITIQTLLSMETVTEKVTFDDEQKVSYSKLIFSAAMNTFAEGGGVPMAPKASADDGCLSFSSAFGVPKLLTFCVLPFLVLAKHEKLSCFDIRNFKECDIELSAPMVLHADGEYLGDVANVHFECLHGVMRVL